MVAARRAARTHLLDEMTQSPHLKNPDNKANVLQEGSISICAEQERKERTEVKAMKLR